MAHRDYLNQDASKGNRRTRGGAGRHNPGATSYSRTPDAGIRICLGNGCGRPFKSKGPWNRFCGKCKKRDDPDKNRHAHKVPPEWANTLSYNELNEF